MLVTTSTVVLMHQLQQEIAQQKNKNIPHSGAVLDINKIKKENTNMVEKLQAYLAELMQNAATVEARDDSVVIAEKVANFKEALEKEYAEAKAIELAKINSDIDCINTIIARENEKIIAAVETPVIV